MDFPQDRYNYDYSDQSPVETSYPTSKPPLQRKPGSMCRGFPDKEGQTDGVELREVDGSTPGQQDFIRGGGHEPGQSRVSRYFSGALQAEYSRGLEDYLRFPDS
ncbi:uncharacterized protein DSM5745_04981 [Aspergillus mulundensis]|uniref:Uncharacterized protein n=1 Tax=Aspergillus mulundensis TaxID=1810919 RepID=A0A3D8S5Y8_9EURO|nr:hypothetical protein DSM5745_04981 [Aspergillus mulundensis]RDW81424.1 hypothetical protein DSM5745_04981 [Aspergillus mulundensis]